LLFSFQRPSTSPRPENPSPESSPDRRGVARTTVLRQGRAALLPLPPRIRQEESSKRIRTSFLAPKGLTSTSTVFGSSSSRRSSSRPPFCSRRALLLPFAGLPVNPLPTRSVGRFREGASTIPSRGARQEDPRNFQRFHLGTSVFGGAASTPCIGRRQGRFVRPVRLPNFGGVLLTPCTARRQGRPSLPLSVIGAVLLIPVRSCRQQEPERNSIRPRARRAAGRAFYPRPSAESSALSGRREMPTYRLISGRLPVGAPDDRQRAPQPRSSAPPRRHASARAAARTSRRPARRARSAAAIASSRASASSTASFSTT